MPIEVVLEQLVPIPDRTIGRTASCVVDFWRKHVVVPHEVETKAKNGKTGKESKAGSGEVPHICTSGPGY